MRSLHLRNAAIATHMRGFSFVVYKRNQRQTFGVAEDSPFVVLCGLCAMEFRKLAELRVAFALGHAEPSEMNAHFVNDILIDARCGIGRRRRGRIVADKSLSNKPHSGKSPGECIVAGRAPTFSFFRAFAGEPSLGGDRDLRRLGPATCHPVSKTRIKSTRRPAPRRPFLFASLGPDPVVRLQAPLRRCCAKTRVMTKTQRAHFFITQ